jgi:hypothetical protein
MDKKAYTPPRIIQYVPNQVAETIIQLFRDELPPATSESSWIAPADVVNSRVFERLNSPVKQNG